MRRPSLSLSSGLRGRCCNAMSLKYQPIIVLIKCRYLYERELYSSALEFLAFGLQTLPESEALMYAAACTLRGLIELDKLELDAALSSFYEGLKIREKLLYPNDEFIASSLNAIAIAYTESGDLDEAVKHHSRAIRIREGNNSDRIGNSYSNMSSTLLRMGQPDEAEKVLMQCPSLKDFTDETFLSSGNPRFAGCVCIHSLGSFRSIELIFDCTVT